jgi:lipid-A-disaccharide synthase
MPAADGAIMVVAGEASGDLHGATLCRALRALAPDRPLRGMGGERMAAAGLDRLADVTRVAAVGGPEALGRLPALVRAWRRLCAELRGSDPPAVVVLIDFPEFNMRLAGVARRLGIPVVYFIPPQVWAWRPWRVHALARRVALVLAVLPFEVPLYRAAGVRVEYVGHPVLDALVDAPDRDLARRRLDLADAGTVVGLLPGSRAQEIEGTLPVLHAAAAQIAAAYPGTRFVLGALGSGGGADPATLLGSAAPPVQIVRGDTYAVMRAADLLLATSGTATLEAALLGTPMVVCYRLAPLTGVWVFRLARVPWISLANITLGRAVLPELYLRAFTPDRVAAAALALLGSPAALERQREAFAELRGVLGEPGVGLRAARHVLALLDGADRWPRGGAITLPLRVAPSPGVS